MKIMRWPWKKKEVKIDYGRLSGGACTCAGCGETVRMYADCFCDRLEKGTLTAVDKKWLEEHPEYKR